ncbi:HIT family protein [Neobacillus notoginsengisoli]|uniref:HIT family protein n=1 Tax=Neobacillus notoginsengisoli TaxID=1578198 RepID=A0A417YZM2_9BACI|nr:HIT family protein [Neobacillus notoginsengisoli]RHW43340.1 HIT family protein [Neobacillus notoginsengisoli]
MEECIFCKIITKEADAQILFENEYVCCFLDKYPINKGHVLVVPKKHYPEFTQVDQDSLSKIIITAKRIAAQLQKVLNPDGITIMQNNGVFKDVNHYHMHIIPRFLNDGFGWIEPNNSVSHDEFTEIGFILKKSLTNSAD